MPVPRGHIWQSWEWDTVSKSPDAHMSQCGQAVYFHISPLLESEGTAAVRGNKGFTHGEHYWEIEFLEPPYGTSVMVGVGTQNAPLHAGDDQFVNLISMDTEGWGLSYKGVLWHNGESKKYTEPFYEINTVIGVLLNCSTGTLTFYRNGQNLGLAFSDLNQVRGALYPMVSSTTPESELQLGIRSSRLSSLQELCTHTPSHTASALDAHMHCPYLLHFVAKYATITQTFNATHCIHEITRAVLLVINAVKQIHDLRFGFMLKMS